MIDAPSNAALRSRQLSGIKPQIFASPAHHAVIDNLTRTTKWHFSLSPLSMNGDHDLTLMPPVMFVMVDAATLSYKPLSKRAAFHCSNSADSQLRP
jgi:hypothetical protein